MGKEDSFLLGKDMLFVAIVIPVIFIVIVLLALIANSLAVKSFDVYDLQHGLLISRLLYSEDCFAADGRVGVIDIGKFRDERLGRCLNIEDENLGVRVRLKYNNLEKELRVNELMTSRDFLCGKKNSFCSEQRHYVLVEDEEEYGGYFDVEIIELRK